jgi:hypothetical protein
MKLSMKTLSAACLLALAPAAAMANLTPVYTGNVAGPGFFTWTYNVQLASDQDVNAGTPPASNPVGPSNAGTGGFLTIYDFYGYIAGSCAGPTGWSCTAQNVGFTPFDVAPIDRPDIVNLTWVYTSGPDILGAAISNAGTDLGNFTANTLFSLTDTVSYAARGIKNNGLQAGSTADNVGSATGPRDVTLEIPEPGSLALMALGLGFVGMTRRKAKKAA